MVYLPREGCEIIDTWNVMGMRGTGSHDISVTDVYGTKVQNFPYGAGLRAGIALSGPAV